MHRSVPTSVNRVSTEHRSHNCNPSLSFPCPSFILPSPCLPVRRRASLSHLPFLYRTFSLYYFLQSDFAGRSSTISLSPSFSCLFASPARHLFFLFIRAVFFRSTRSILVAVFLRCPPDSRLPRIPRASRTRNFLQLCAPRRSNSWN